MLGMKSVVRFSSHISFFSAVRSFAETAAVVLNPSEISLGQFRKMRWEVFG